jgi:glutamine amidotransferase
LSRAHPDGWGVAVLDANDAWEVERRAECAGRDAVFETVADTISGIALVAHIRARTVGPVSVANTHPFRRGGWVFAHNGTVDDDRFLLGRTSRERRSECEGQTDSEMLFAYLLTRLDESGLANAQWSHELDHVVAHAVASAAEARIGSLNFVLSNGFALYAARQGRSLYMLQRRPSEGGPDAFLVASEPVTHEMWQQLDDGVLLRCKRGVALDVRFLRGRDPRPVYDSTVELPFTD